MNSVNRMLVRAVVAGAVWLPAAHAQNYPTKPIRVISGAFAGSAVDVGMRMVAPIVGMALDQPLVIENRVGAGGVLATLAVKNAAPDGYSLLLMTPSYVLQFHRLKSPGYDPVRDFSPITKVVDTPGLFVVSAALPVSSMTEFIEYAKRNPGKIAYGSTGVGSLFHLSGEAFSLDTGIRMLHVPYASGGLSLPLMDLASNRIQLSFPSYSGLLPVLQSGNVKILSVLDKTRSKRLPETPAVTETLPTSTLFPSGFGLLGPAGMPRPFAARLQTEIRKALRDPEVSAKLEALGANLGGDTPEEWGEEIRTSMESVGRIVKALKLEPE